MTRSELIDQVHKLNPDIPAQQVEASINAIFDEISQTLSKGERVELRDFGVFTVRKRDQRTGRNPRTGEVVHVSEKKVPFFKAGKLLKERLNP